MEYDFEDIEEITVHWSESNVLNDELGADDDCDIEKTIAPLALSCLFERAAGEIEGGYDKQSLTIKMKDGSILAKECKFYLMRDYAGLQEMIFG